MSCSRQQNGQAACKCSQTPPECIKVLPAYLTAFIALNGFALAVVVLVASLAFHFAIITPTPEASDPEPPPPPQVVLIQPPWTIENSIGDVVVDLSKNEWADELTDALRQIRKALDNVGNPSRGVVVDPAENAWVKQLQGTLQQILETLENGTGSSQNVVVDPKKNQWIVELINGLSEANKRQPCTPGAVANPISDGNNESECQARNCLTPSESKNSTCNVVVDLEKPAWVDDLINSLHGAIEFYAIDPAIRADVKKHLKCEGKPLSVSSLIRFQGGKHSLDKTAEGRIDKFAARIDKKTSKWGVFGFASEEGSKTTNRKLSWQRACEVKKHICKNDADSPLCKRNCDTYPQDEGAEAGHRCMPARGNQETDFPICFLGEQHFINGVADSRSVVIAACGKQD